MALHTEAVASPAFPSNFSHTLSVIFDHPISEVFRIIATKEGIEPIFRFSPLIVGCSLVKEDTIALPSHLKLDDVQARTMPNYDGQGDPGNARILPRQSFKFHEEVSGEAIHAAGALTWDETLKIALYESFIPDTEIQVRIMRRFYVVEDDGPSTGAEGEPGKARQRTRLTEELHGYCPEPSRSQVEDAVFKSHAILVKSFHKLFE